MLIQIKRFFQVYIDPISVICGIIIGALVSFSFKMNANTWDIVSAIGTVSAAIIAVLTYRASVKRQRKQDTIREFSAIREEYPNLSPKAPNPVSDEERIKYLKEMERFCTGVNVGLYDICVVNKMAGAMLITQYDSYMKGLIQGRKKRTKQNADENDIYSEYTEFIERLRKYR